MACGNTVAVFMGEMGYWSVVIINILHAVGPAEPPSVPKAALL